MVIAGPTAAGKTALAIGVAVHFATEIISADSRQFYREMTLGTAKPTKEQLAAVPHHMINNKSVTELYGAGHFAADALPLIGELHRTHRLVVMAGGSGLYIDAVLNGVDAFEEVPVHVREALNAEYREKGIGWLQEQVKKADPAFFAGADIQNHQRLVRALEVYRHTGKPFSQFRSNTVAQRDFESINILVNPGRAELYDRINKRVDDMIQAGLVEEARKLHPLKSNNALLTVGYKELFDHFDGRLSLEQAVEKIKQHTRNYAKRQLTWFRNRDSFTEFHPSQTEAVIRFIEKRTG